MKILNTTEFAKLPEGVLFSPCGDYSIGELCIKGESFQCTKVFANEDPSYTVYISGIEDEGTSDETDNQPLESGMSIPVSFLSCPGKYHYVKNAKFAVWEKEDLLTLATIVEKALEVTKL